MNNKEYIATDCSNLLQYALLLDELIPKEDKDKHDGLCSLLVFCSKALDNEDSFYYNDGSDVEITKDIINIIGLIKDIVENAGAEYIVFNYCDSDKPNFVNINISFNSFITKENYAKRKEIYTEKDFKLFEKICKDMNIPVVDEPGGIFIDGIDAAEFIKTHKLFDYKED